MSTPARRGRPPRISAAQVVEAALELAVDELTIAAVARELGVAAPAIYRYFDSREDLQAAVLAEVLGHLDLEGVEGWRDYLVGYARELQIVLHRYPALIGVTAAQHWELLGPLVAPILNGALARLLPAGFTPAEAVALVSAVGGLVHSAVAAASGAAGAPPPDFAEVSAGAQTEAVHQVLRTRRPMDVAGSDALRWLLDGAAADVAARS